MRIVNLALKCCKSLLFAYGIVIMLFSFASAYDLKEYFPLGEGNKWSYVATVTGGDKDDYSKREIMIIGKEMIGENETVKFIYSDDENECLALDAEGVKRYKFFSLDDYMLFKPAMMLFPVDLAVGETREYTLEAEKVHHKVGSAEDTTDRENFKGTIQITFESIEDVSVPAGTFTGCLKFSSLCNLEESTHYFKEKCISWLASGVGYVKETCQVNEFAAADMGEGEEFTETFELLSASVDGKNIGSL